MKRARALLIAALAVGASGVVAVPGGWAAATETGPSCGAHDGRAKAPQLTAAERAEQVRDPEAVPAAAAWQASAQIDAALTRMQRQIAQSPKVLGWYRDHTRSNGIVVLISPDAAGDPELRRALSSAAGGNVAIAFDAACTSSEDFQQVERDISADLQSDQTPFGLFFDPTSQQVVAFLAPDRADRGRSIEAEHGSKVRVDMGGADFDSRDVDSSPHYGSALIRSRYSICTSGFVMVNGSGKWATTAAHCTSNDFAVPFYSGFSSGVLQGTTNANGWNGSRDIVTIGSAAETYTNRIYTDPGTPSVRNVTSRVREGATNFCVNGYFHRSTCGVTQVDPVGQICGNNYPDANGNRVYRCIYGYVGGYSADPNRILSEDGDSGGTVYGRDGTDNASARGMISGSFDGGRFVLIEEIREIEDGTGAAIAVACCADNSV